MQILQKEFELLEKELKKSLLLEENHLSDDIYNFVFRKSKKLRPKLILLFTKALDKEINSNVLSLACATELLHNSTLIHDDIIDNAFLRRGAETLNRKFNNSISVLAGDYLLALSMSIFSKCENIEIFVEFSKSMMNMCKGEINQFFDKKKILTINEYIEKSKNKTAELFRASLVSLCNIYPIKEKIQIEEFAINYGIAFQLKDDLLNILNVDFSKPSLSDVYNGIYTAPVIFLNEDINIHNLDEKTILETLNKNQKYVDKTKELIKKHVERAIHSISFIKDSEYKKQIIALCNDLNNYSY